MWSNLQNYVSLAAYTSNLTKWSEISNLIKSIYIYIYIENTGNPQNNEMTSTAIAPFMLVRFPSFTNRTKNGVRGTFILANKISLYDQKGLHKVNWLYKCNYDTNSTTPRGQLPIHVVHHDPSTLRKTFLWSISHPIYSFNHLSTLRSKILFKPIYSNYNWRIVADRTQICYMKEPFYHIDYKERNTPRKQPIHWLPRKSHPKSITYYMETTAFRMKIALTITMKLIGSTYGCKTYRSILQVKICYRVQSFSSFLLF